MDRILKFVSDSIFQKPNADIISKTLGTERSETLSAFNDVCERGHSLQILKATKLGYGNYELVSFDKVKLQNFISQGGFRGHSNRQRLSSKLFGIRMTRDAKVAILSIISTVVAAIIVGLFSHQLGWICQCP